MTSSNSGATASITLQANVDQFNNSMRTASQNTSQAMQQMKREAEMVGLAMKGVALVAVGAATVIVTSTIQQMDQMGKMAGVAGSSVEAFSRLTFAAQRHGIAAEALSGIYKDVQEKIGDFLQTGGGEMKDFFDKIAPKVGVTADQFRRLSGPEALELYYNSLQKANLSQSELTFYMESIASDSSKLIPLLKDNGAGFKGMADEADRLGQTLQTKTSKEATNFLDTMAKLDLQQKAFASTITASVLPVLQVIADKTLTAAQQSDKFATAGKAARVVLQTLFVLGAEVAFVFGRVGNTIGGTAAQLDRLARLDFKGVGNINDMIKADDEKARKDHDAFLKSIMDPPDSIGGGRGIVNPALVKPDKPNDPKKPPVNKPSGGAPKDPNADFQAYMKNLDGQIQKMQELTVVEKLLADIRKGDLTVNPAQQQTLTLLAQAIDKEKEMVETLKMSRDVAMSAGDAVSRANEEFQNQAVQNAANVENIRVGLLSQMDQEALAHELRLEELQKFHDLKLDNVLQANALIEAENARHEQTKLELQTANQLSSLSMAGNAADALYGMMEKAGKEQSALGKGLFLASKAIAVAEIILNTEVAAAKAGAQLGIFGLPMATMIRVTGYASAGMVAGMAIADASAEGGYDIPAGTNPMTQLHEREMVLPKAQADVIRGLASDGGGGAPITWTIVNQTSAPIGQVTEQRISATERALIIQEAVGTTAAQFGDPNSQTSRALSRNYATQRSR